MVFMGVEYRRPPHPARCGHSGPDRPRSWQREPAPTLAGLASGELKGQQSHLLPRMLDTGQVLPGLLCPRYPGGGS